MLVTACTLDGAETSFTVRVRDAVRVPVAEAVVVLDMDEFDDDELCQLSLDDGVAEIVWNECEFGAFDCDQAPYAVRVSKEGYRKVVRPMGFSRERSVEVTLESCDGDCEAPETCD